MVASMPRRLPNPSRRVDDDGYPLAATPGALQPRDETVICLGNNEVLSEGRNEGIEVQGLGVPAFQLFAEGGDAVAGGFEVSEGPVDGHAGR